MNDTLTLALSTGRIFNETLPLLYGAGITIFDDVNISRKLILATNQSDIRIIIVRPLDVPTYVEYGGADLGVAGKDVLLENPDAQIYEPVDLQISRCRLMTAGRDKQMNQTGRLKVATKFVESARRFYAERGQQVDIIKLYGSMELAPLVGMADRIVDVVNTGNTLLANGLVPIDHIADISARLIVNKAAMKMKHRQIQQFINRLCEQVKT